MLCECSWFLSHKNVCVWCGCSVFGVAIMLSSPPTPQSFSLSLSLSFSLCFFFLCFSRFLKTKWWWERVCVCVWWRTSVCPWWSVCVCVSLMECVCVRWRTSVCVSLMENECVSLMECVCVPNWEWVCVCPWLLRPWTFCGLWILLCFPCFADSPAGGLIAVCLLGARSEPVL